MKLKIIAYLDLTHFYNSLDFFFSLIQSCALTLYFHLNLICVFLDLVRYKITLEIYSGSGMHLILIRLGMNRWICIK